jgi:Cu/Ag efflux pump CusA
MSLRIFHIIFIIVCVGLSVCVGVWGIRDYMQERSLGALALAIGFLLGGVVLVLYGRSAYQKLRDLP